MNFIYIDIFLSWTRNNFSQLFILKLISLTYFFILFILKNFNQPI